MSTRDFQQQTPLPFDTPLPADPISQPPQELKIEKGTDRLAKDFVRWCCSFGTEFRNSPDLTNFRYWARKNKVKIKERQQAEVLDSARLLFSKRIEQRIRKSEIQN